MLYRLSYEIAFLKSRAKIEQSRGNNQTELESYLRVSNPIAMDHAQSAGRPAQKYLGVITLLTLKSSS